MSVNMWVELVVGSKILNGGYWKAGMPAGTWPVKCSYSNHFSCQNFHVQGSNSTSENGSPSLPTIENICVSLAISDIQAYEIPVAPKRTKTLRHVDTNQIILARTTERLVIGEQTHSSFYAKIIKFWLKIQDALTLFRMFKVCVVTFMKSGTVMQIALITILHSRNNCCLFSIIPWIVGTNPFLCNLSPICGSS